MWMCVLHWYSCHLWPNLENFSRSALQIGTYGSPPSCLSHMCTCAVGDNTKWWIFFCFSAWLMVVFLFFSMHRLTCSVTLKRLGQSPAGHLDKAEQGARTFKLKELRLRWGDWGWQKSRSYGTGQDFCERFACCREDRSGWGTNGQDKWYFIQGFW